MSAPVRSRGLQLAALVAICALALAPSPSRAQSARSVEGASGGVNDGGDRDN
jgi:hypothetical protein